MSGPDERPLSRRSGRVLMVGTIVLAVAAAVVLALGAQDAHLLRLGLIAALWAALLGAFAAARMRREISSDTDRADELRTVYQLELEREVAARQEHLVTVERELREQAERGEIAALRAELAAMRTNLEKLIGGDPLVERLELRAESSRLLPMAAYPHKFDDSPSSGATAKVTQVAPLVARSLTTAGLSVRAPGGPGSAVFGSQDLREPLGEQVCADRSPAGGALPTSEWPVNGHSETAPTPHEDSELRFGPGRPYRPELDTQVPPPAALSSSWSPARRNNGIPYPQGNGGHGAPAGESSGSDNNRFHNNGSHNNGSHNNGSHANGSHANGSHANGSHANGSHANGSHANGSHANGSHANGSHANGSHANGSHANGSHANGSHANGSHVNGSPVNGSHVNGSHVNGSHSDGGRAARRAQDASAVGAQRSVNDLLAAHGASSTPRRRRSREDG